MNTNTNTLRLCQVLDKLFTPRAEWDYKKTTEYEQDFARTHAVEATVGCVPDAG
jgi:hypothetical protein